MAKYKNGILENIKYAIAEYYDFETKSVKEVGTKGDSLDEDRRILLGDIIDLCLNTKYINEETKMYLELSDVGLSYLSDAIFKRTGREVPYRTINSKVHFCGRKMAQDLGENIIIDIRDKRKPPIDDYVDRVNNLRIKYKKFDSLDNKLVIDLSDIKASNKKYETSEIREVLNKLEPYSKRKVESLFSEHDKEILGYLKYVSGTSFIDEESSKIKVFIDSL